MLYVVSYDIADDKRRLRVAKLMERHGLRIQRSVFECRIDSKALGLLLKEAEAIIDPQCDSVRAYSLCESCAGKTEYIGISVTYSIDDALVA